MSELTAGSFTIADIAPTPIVFEAFEATAANLDREAGSRIPSMYQRIETTSWTKSGPALVALRGERGGTTVQCELAFPLLAAAEGAEAVQLTAGALPAGRIAGTIYKGPRSKLAAGDAALDAWLAKEGHTARGDLRWYVFLNRPDLVSEEELLTRIVQPIE